MDSYKWAIKAYSQGKTFVAFDVETTGLSPVKDRIAEIGAVKFSNAGIVANFSTLVNPGIPMPAAAGRVNKITDIMLAGQPPIEKVLPEFLEFISGSIVIAHNAPFDCGFIRENLARLFDIGLVPCRSLPNKIVDTLNLARRLFPGRNRYNLQELALDLGIQAAQAHRAADDARLCMEIFVKACCNYSNTRI